MPLFDTPTIPSCVFTCSYNHVTSQVVLEVKNPPADAGDTEDVGLLPGLGRSPGEGHGNPLQYSCPENPPWGEEAGGLQSTGSQRVRCD